MKKFVAFNQITLTQSLCFMKCMIYREATMAFLSSWMLILTYDIV